ncbi:MAG: Lrp/AsnC family transcriptional regulator [Alphaproteobacteria bacterium]|nr:Lrp/AsnC family transcriptional regulator [Alphaproteobacteria bacterium]
MDSPLALDRFEIAILARLQTDARLALNDLAAELGLSHSACWRRVRRLEEEGVIRARVALLDRARLGLDFLVLASVKLAQPNRANMDAFEAAVRRWPEVLDCYTVTGAVDYMLRIVTTDIKAYDAFLRSALLEEPHVQDVESRIVVHAVKETTALPLPPLRVD